MLPPEVLQAVALFLTTMLYVPAVSPLKALDAWKVLPPSILYSKPEPTASITMLPSLRAGQDATVGSVATVFVITGAVGTASIVTVDAATVEHVLSDVLLTVTV